MIESTTVFLNIRNLGKVMNNPTVYFVGGLCSIILYPVIRIFFCIYCSYTAYYGVAHVFVGTGCVPVVLTMNGFVFCISIYYTIFELWKDPQRMYRLKQKKLE